MSDDTIVNSQTLENIDASNRYRILTELQLKFNVIIAATHPDVIVEISSNLGLDLIKIRSGTESDWMTARIQLDDGRNSTR